MPNIVIDDKLIDKIFSYTKSIAIVGLSPNPQKDSHRVGKFLKEVGFDIIPIYPKEDEILGCKVYRSLLEVPQKIDMVDMFRKGEFASTLLSQIQKRDDVKCLWLQKGIVNNEVGKKCEELGIDFVQNRCSMVEYKVLQNIR